ncbi:uncharacterized protein [Neodiprion pinetum]|uniref:uncharacterized protein n=1 Tax=Neodiprion pinetum TaxID=441929 RepID=UPI001EDF2F3D|nr:uncharacterized protein LOC124218504 [Neodiprion pinetum]
MAAATSDQPATSDVKEGSLKVSETPPPPQLLRTSNYGQRAFSNKDAAQSSLNSEDSPQAVLLATARATAFNDDQGLSQAVRLLIDPCSELSFISERVVNDLRLQRKATAVSIIGIGGFNTGPIDALIGADAYGKIIEPQIVKSDSHGLIAQQTKLGWVISGPVDATVRHVRASHSAVRSGGSEDEDLSQILQRYWIQEEIPSTAGAETNPDDLICEQHFKDTHSRESTGRYIVRLPFKESTSLLGESKPTALRCLRRVAKRLSTDASYRQLYTEFIKEHESLGHMETVSDHSETSAAIYLPHLGVLKEDRVTTKLRVVFNGSCRTSSGVSINEILHAGGKLQVDASDVLIWLRRSRWIFGTDIVKMFRQIKVHQDDWDYQRILWFDEDENFVTFRLTTVTYGMTCAPWLSLRVLHQLTEDEGHRFPLAVPSLTQGRYVDDIFGGSDTRDDIKAVILDLIGICNAEGFPLQKWNSNCPKILNELGLQPSPDATIQFDDKAVSVLGMCWHPASDSLRFKAKVFASPTFTKRSVLSEISQVYDPLGCISPVIIRAKILIQELWLLKVGWDDPLPSDVVTRWLEFRTELAQLNNIIIPRCLQITSLDTVFHLHGFSDASVAAMSAVVYIRTEHQGQPTTVSLVCAKTKVKPIKKPVIARLELTAALMLSKLMAYAQRMLGVETIQLYCWTDSSVTLAWVFSHPSRWKEFVRNRVAKIQEIIPQGQWRHVGGKENSADCASRGISPSDLENHPLWWTGPSWLVEQPSFWSTFSGDVTAEEAPETQTNPPRHSALSAHTIKASVWDLLERYSRLSKLLQVTATVKRAIRQLRREKIYETSVLDTQELEEARIFWIKAIQNQFYGGVIKTLQDGLNVPTSDPISRLTPFVDQQGILRIGGRLKFSNLSDKEKQPAILPRTSRFTDLVVEDAHKRALHGGTQLTLACTRERYWIIGGRPSVRARIYKCVVCARQHELRARQLMAQLPASRITPSRPFFHSGVDYAGPFTIKTWRGRAAKSHKGYIAVFVCFSTSAAHLELVTDYTSEAFVAAYKRFTDRRGICATLQSDRGTTFVGADKQLWRLFEQASAESNHLSASLASHSTKWIFNPAAAPHFGGKWEATVKSVKHHFKRIIGDSNLTYEEFTTLLVQIEAILNSLPLCPISDGSEDLAALTPGHFLIGESLITVPQPDSISEWRHPSTEIKTGSVVLITDERFPPSQWPLARVTRVFPGSDGLVRVVELCTTTTTLTRPVTKLSILPIDSSDTLSQS